MRPCYGLAASSRGARLAPWPFERRELRPGDVALRIRFCGVCHSDLHAIRGTGRFPLVPGHEIVGAHVVLFSTSPAKLANARALGADEAILSTDAGQMTAQAHRFDFILDTVSAPHPLDPYLRALTLDGTLCCLGIPAAMEFSPVLLTMGRRRLASSGVAGTLETQEMLDFCSGHGIAAEVELIAAADIDDGLDRLERGDVRYRLVIDMGTLVAPATAGA